MPNTNIKTLRGLNYNMQPDQYAQHNGSANVKFKVVLKDNTDDYTIVIQEMESDLEYPLCRPSKSLLLTQILYDKILDRISATGLYQLAGGSDGPKRGRTVVFERKELFVWSGGL